MFFHGNDSPHERRNVCVAKCVTDEKSVYNDWYMLLCIVYVPNFVLILIHYVKMYIYHTSKVYIIMTSSLKITKIIGTIACGRHFMSYIDHIKTWHVNMPILSHHRSNYWHITCMSMSHFFLSWILIMICLWY